MNNTLGQRIKATWEFKRDSIDPSNEKSLISLAVESFRSIKFIVSVWDDVSGKSVSYDMNVTLTEGNAKESVFGKVGGGVSHTISANVVLGVCNVKVKNTGPRTIMIEHARLILGRM